MILFFLLVPIPLWAQTNELEDLARQEKEMLSLLYETSTLSTKTVRAIADVPAVITVITAEQIRRIGARDLRDVLNLIPGLQMGMAAVGYPSLTFRGMPSHGTEKIKFIIDGHNVDLNLTGGSALLFANMPVEYIQKVEFMRGPGSTLYGSDAVLGVINIVTRKETSRETAAVSGRLGSNEKQQYNVEAGKSFGALNLWGNLNYFNTNGASVHVAKDALSSSPLNKSVSNAPTTTSEWVERTDISLAADLGKFRLQGQYISSHDGGFFNPGHSLTDQTNICREYFWTDLTYENSYSADRLTVMAKLFYNRYDHDYDVLLQPAGFRSQQGTYPQGIRSISQALVEDSGLELQADSYLIDSHTLTLGGELKNSRLHDVRHLANYNPKPLPSVRNVSYTFNWITPADRINYSFFVQDQWQMRDSLLGTIGVRYDDYDDFGNAVSPTVGLAWQYAENWQLKLLYGEAFRAPSFRELYKQPAGSPLRGNPDLDAEDIATWQASLGWEITDISLTLTAYRNDFHNEIQTMDLQSDQRIFVNTGNSRSVGTDLEVRWRLPASSPDITLFGSVSYVDSELENGDDKPGSASWLGLLGFDWTFARYYNLNMTNNYTGKVPLYPDVSDQDLDDYLLTNVTLTARDGFGYLFGFDISASVYNLFDVHYAYPDLSGKLPAHYERPGITAELWLTYRF